MDRLENRELEYFVTVAQELHFGRAAERLGISQPPLSRAISRLERRVRVQLLERTSRQVRLTPAGEVFLHEAIKALAAVDRVMLTTRRAQDATPVTIAARPGANAGLVRTLLDAYERLPSSRPVQVVFTNDQAAAVRDSSAQFALLCATSDLSGLASVSLAIERPVAFIAAGHSLGGRTTVALGDLEREPHFQLQCPAQPTDELLDLVALGRLIMMGGRSTADRIDNSIRAVPVSDLPDSLVLLAWPDEVLSPAGADFVRCAELAMAGRPLRSAG